jgi:hypothetical protein
MVVGPGEAAIALNSLSIAERLFPEAEFWILDDSTTDGTYDRVSAWAALRGAKAFLLRNHLPRGYNGLIASIFTLLSSIHATDRSYRFVVKMDPDALIIRATFADVVERRFARFGPGMVGAYRRGADGGRRPISTRQQVKILLDAFPVGLDRGTGKIRLGSVFYTRFIPAALRSGYALGENVLGGLYCLHAETLRALIEAGFIRELPQPWKSQLKEEDILISLAVRSVGHALVDINDDIDGRVAWLQYQAPLPLSAGEVVDRAIAALHPVKSEHDEIRRRVTLSESAGVA